MSTQLQTSKQFFQSPAITKKFNEMLGEKKAQGFITSILQVVTNSNLLSKADPQTVYNAAATAAVLDLPIQPSLGFAYIVPYKGQAQFQIGWKGLVQLAQRTGQYHRINAVEVYKSQFKSFDPITEELILDKSVEPTGEVVGYVAYFKLVNGFEKMTYWSKDRVIKHAKKYSQSYGKGSMSPWNDVDQFDAMALKTVLKNTLSKYGPLSIEMQKAIEVDQAVIEGETQDVNYVDATPAPMTDEDQCSAMIANFEGTAEEFDKMVDSFPDQARQDLEVMIFQKRSEL